ncbi:MAG TPA: divalent metal cation transporter [Sedimentisphaerales bacterium]|nr:divalent metal cation transporter [Sedimentisphaerales bacterium]
MTPDKTKRSSAPTPATQGQQMAHMNPRIEKDREAIVMARQKGTGALVKTLLRLSGPGWLQSGITVGGVSFSSSLYLGVLVGFSMMWLQPVAMILGIIMLGAIAYVTLSIRERPLKAINDHVSPVLGWSWLFASMAANLVWSMPQYTLGTRAMQQNLFPSILGPEAIPDPWGRIICVGFILAICITATMFYGAGGRGVKVFEIIIKSIVSMIVLSFMGVVIKLSLAGAIDWGQILRGLIPRVSMLWEPAATMKAQIEAVAPEFQQFWTKLVVGQQRDVMIAATAAAVGINMTFLLPYSMLRKGWDRDFRGLAIFDLSTGLFIPFILATGFVIIASASRFYAAPAPGFVPDEPGGVVTVEPAQNLVASYKTLLQQRLQFETGADGVAGLSSEQLEQRTEALPYADRKMAAMLIKRDNLNLAKSLEPLTGEFLAQFVFGLGVLGMGISAATMLMTINGLCLCELLNRPLRGWTQRIGSLIPGVAALAAILWNSPAPWLAMPTSVFCIILLPIAYFAFLLLMNQKSMLGKDMPQGGKRLLWNVLMAIATAAATLVSIWSLWSRLRVWGIVVIVAFVGLILVVHFIRKGKQTAAA